MVESSQFESPTALQTPDGLKTPLEGMSARQLNVLKRKAKFNKTTAANK
jgi:hypothetical protein